MIKHGLPEIWDGSYHGTASDGWIGSYMTTGPMCHLIVKGWTGGQQCAGRHLAPAIPGLTPPRREETCPLHQDHRVMTLCCGHFACDIFQSSTAPFYNSKSFSETYCHSWSSQNLSKATFVQRSLNTVMPGTLCYVPVFGSHDWKLKFYWNKWFGQKGCIPHESQAMKS